MGQSVNGFPLQKKIDNQSHQRSILIGSRIPGHEKQQKHHHQILCVKILGKQTFQKAADTARSVVICRRPSRRGNMRIAVMLPWRRAALIGAVGRLPLHRLLHGRRRRGGSFPFRRGLWNPAPAKGAIRLGYISIIHGATFLKAGIAPGRLPFPMQFLPSLQHAWPVPAFPASACSGTAAGLSAGIPGSCRWSPAASGWPPC